MIDRSLVEIDRAAVRHNVRLLRRRVARLWAVVKCDGYGHGAEVVAGAALEAGAIGLGVATVAEALPLRRAFPEARVMILSPLQPGEEDDLDGCEAMASTPDGAARLLQSGAGVHVKVDSGMGRWGLHPSAALEIGRQLARDGRLRGLASHLATAEEVDTSFFDEQMRRFREVAATFPDCPRHIANSAGLLYHPTAYEEGRAGIAVYGISPRGDAPGADGLRPVLSWRSSVTSVRDLAAGESSGYGRRFVAAERRQVALVPVGFGDGYPRSASGVGEVLIGHRRMRVAATVSMDQLTVAVPRGAGVAPGDPVTLIGRDGSEEVTASEVAARAGTIAYEVVCGLRVARGRRAVVDA